VRLAAACRSAGAAPSWAGRRELLCFPGLKKQYHTGTAGRRERERERGEKKVDDRTTDGMAGYTGTVVVVFFT
jgi:hypothetical protein